MAQLNIAWRGNVEPRTRNDYATSSLRRAKINIRPSFPPFALYIAIKEKKGKKGKKGKKEKRKIPLTSLNDVWDRIIKSQIGDKNMRNYFKIILKRLTFLTEPTLFQHVLPRSFHN